MSSGRRYVLRSVSKARASRRTATLAPSVSKTGETAGGLGSRERTRAPGARRIRTSSESRPDDAVPSCLRVGLRAVVS